MEGINQITIDVSAIRDEARGILSMMGKRLSTKEGNTLFTSSTLSSAEEKYLIAYLRKGVSVFFSEFSRQITGFEDGEIIQMEFATPITSEEKMSAFRENFINFVVEYIQLKVFGLSLSDEARKSISDDMQVFLSAAKNLIPYVLSAPSVPIRPVDDEEKNPTDDTDNEEDEEDKGSDDVVVFNSLHPEHYIREQGWKPTPNPFLPKPPRPGHKYVEKHIFIYANQLWYDVDATTLMIGRARRGNQTNQEENIPTSENDQERPLFYRWFDTYIKKVEALLSAYVMKPEGKVVDNALREWSEKEIWLKMPDSWDDTRYDELVQAIHNYISKGALYEYLKINLTGKDQSTIDMKEGLDDAELEIIDAANAIKVGGMIHTLKPFG